mmetsp:Transcript_12991/g.26135  ORF Transcript_12991/g.26135 Transcript_12991/m.26135 type:complete len:157 (-) Transcript_12991:1623-2093(-)
MCLCAMMHWCLTREMQLRGNHHQEYPPPHMQCKALSNKYGRHKIVEALKSFKDYNICCSPVAVSGRNGGCDSEEGTGERGCVSSALPGAWRSSAMHWRVPPREWRGTATSTRTSYAWPAAGRELFRRRRKSAICMRLRNSAPSSRAASSLGVSGGT